MVYLGINKANKKGKKNMRIPRQLREEAEPGRLERARTASTSKYHTTLTGCTCPDFTYRGGHCKHMLALALAKKRETFAICVGDKVRVMHERVSSGMVGQEGIVVDKAGEWYDVLVEDQVISFTVGDIVLAE